jgi:hypothetical protein
MYLWAWSETFESMPSHSEMLYEKYKIVAKGMKIRVERICCLLK